MLNISLEDTISLWDELDDFSWMGLRDVLEEHREGGNILDEELIDAIMSVAQKLESRGEEFPDTAQELADLLNRELAVLEYTKQKIN